MMKTIFFLIVTGILIAGCSEKKTNATKWRCDFSMPVLVDTIGIEYRTLYSNRRSDKITTGYYPYYYIGAVEDSIYLSYVHFYEYQLGGGSRKETPFSKYVLGFEHFDRYKTADSADVCIAVDTFHSDTYSILLKNNSHDTIFIGDSDLIPLIMEARDTMGDWKPIERRFMHGCATGLYLVYLPPGECVLTGTPKHEGTYKTELRLTIGNNHSASFKGTIDYRQMTQ